MFVAVVVVVGGGGEVLEGEVVGGLVGEKE